MARQQLEYDIAGEDFDPEEDIAQLEHYQIHGDKPMLMPDPYRQFTNWLSGDSVYG